MKMIKRELLLCITLTAFVFVCALAWGSPFLSAGNAPVPVHAQQQAVTPVFKGTVLQNGEHFLLRDASGQSLLLDDPENARGFDGKTVNVTGKLDAHSATIHVERIDPAL